MSTNLFRAEIDTTSFDFCDGSHRCIGAYQTMKSAFPGDLVINVDLKRVPELAFDIRITWCTE